MTLDFFHLSKTYRCRDDDRPALRDVQLTVAPGQFVAVVGHSGTGKSTLLNCAAGLVAPDRGSVVLDGRPVEGPSPLVTLVSSRQHLLPRLSLLDNVRVAARAARPGRGAANDEVAARCLTALGLWPHRMSRPDLLSGPLLLRGALARALAVEPRVLLLDDPFEAIGPAERASVEVQLFDLLADAETGMVLMAPGSLDEAVMLADRVVVLRHPPGPSVAAVVEVDLPRPRDRVALAAGPEFGAIKLELVAILDDLEPGPALVA